MCLSSVLLLTIFFSQIVQRCQVSIEKLYGRTAEFEEERRSLLMALEAKDGLLEEEWRKNAVLVDEIESETAANAKLDENLSEQTRLANDLFSIMRDKEAEFKEKLEK